MSKINEFVSVNNLKRFLQNADERFAPNKNMEGIKSDGSGGYVAGKSGLVPAPSSSSNGKFLRSDGEWAAPEVTNFSVATTSSNGLMSSTDKTKLDGIETGANKYVLPTASSTLGGVKTTSTVTSTSGLIATPIISGVPYYKDTTYSAMSASEATAGTATSSRVITAKVLNDKIDEKISALVNSAPETLDTLNELANALGNDPNFATTVANQIGTKANDSDVVHKSGDETIAGTKTFSKTVHIETIANYPAHNLWIYTGDLNATYGKINIRLDGTITLDCVDAETNKSSQMNLKPDGTLTWDNNEILTRVNGVTLDTAQTITGAKTFAPWTTFSNGINVKWITGNKEQKSLHLFATMNDRYQGYGATLQLHSEDLNGGFRLIANDKTGTNLKILEGDSNGSLKWNGKNVALDENLVHTSGNETIAGTKTFSDVTYSNKELRYKDTKYDWTNTSLDTWCDAGHVAWFDKTGNRRMHELVGTKGGVWNKACYINEKQYFSVDSNSNIAYWGNITFVNNAWFNGNSFLKMTDLESKTTTPTSDQYKHISVVANDGSQVGNIQFCKRADGSFDTTIYSHGGSSDSNNGTLRIASNNEVYPLNKKTKLGTSTFKWSEVWANTFNGNLVGNASTATKATNDSTGQQIDKTYIKELSVSGRTITYKRGDNTTGTITTQDTNTTYSVATTSANGLMSKNDKTKLDGLSNYTLPTASSTLGGVKTTSTVTSTSGLTACPIISGVPYYKDTNTTYSKLSQFTNDSGFITSSGSCANATKATKDSAGQQINTTYIKGVSVSGRTVTFTRGNGTTFAITIQDNVVNNLANSFGSTAVGGICFVSGRTRDNIGGLGATVAGSDIHLVNFLAFQGSGVGVLMGSDYDTDLSGTWKLLGSVNDVDHVGNVVKYKRWTLAIRIA